MDHRNTSAGRLQRADHPSHAIDPISFIVPVKDEHSQVFEVYDQVVANTPQAYRYELIFVDDGSEDDSWTKIVALAALDHGVRGLRFSVDTGTAKALLAGISAASGRVIFTIDARLPEMVLETSRFLDKLEEGYDIVSGAHRNSGCGWACCWSRWISNCVLRTLSRIKLQDYQCGLNCFRSAVAKNLVLEVVDRSAFGTRADDGHPEVADMTIECPPSRSGRTGFWLLDVFSLGRVYRCLQRPSAAIQPLSSTYSLAAGMLFTASISTPVVASDRVEIQTASLVCAGLATVGLVTGWAGEFLVRRGFGPSLSIPVAGDTAEDTVRIGTR